MYHCGMRQVGERHVAYKVDLMVWSNRLDLLALSNFKGEVQIHRLHWQKVWNLIPPKDNVTVKAMAWRPDGKALAIGYSSGSVYIVDIEDREILDNYDLELEQLDEFDCTKYYAITCISWAVRAEIYNSHREYNIYDDSSIFLQKIPANNAYKNQASDSTSRDFKEIQEPTQLNMLLVGYGTGYIYMNIFGRYPYGTIHLAQLAKDDFGEYKVLDINMSDDFSVMQILYVDKISNNVLVALINTSVLSAYAEEILIVAHRHGQISQQMSYVDQTMNSIIEAWEHILLEMDTKMAYYAESVPEGGVSADLLELLMLGSPSDELQLFLLQKLTANDLKKFGNSVELSYSTIQKLVLKQLNIVGQSLTYHLAELRGIARIPDRYKILGLEESTVTAAIKACCAFLNKCLELQQVIDVSMRNYKAFFRWLFVVIVRLLDEQAPSDIVKINQQEQSHIAEFLYNFDNVQVENSESGPDKPVRFNLERLGQYLQDQELTILPDDDDNLWHKFLKDNQCLLKDNDTIFPMAEFKKFSLFQQKKFLKSAIYDVFDITQKDAGKYFSVLNHLKCYEEQLCGKLSDNLRVSQIFDATGKRFMMAFMDANNGKEGIYFISANIKEKACTANAMKYYFSSKLIPDNSKEISKDDSVEVFDLQFYSAEYLSLLLRHPHSNESTVFVQLPLNVLFENSNEINMKSKSYIFNNMAHKKDISPILEQGVYKVLDKMDGFRIAVSGGRKVAVVLSKSCRKVRVFEMEVDGDDDEDETLDSTPQSIANSQNTSNTQNVTSDALNE
ncbi:hypothetical protein K1T71_005043 [Dendrolimus kikuchii]|uniref:Uncharacterized protein n=1 Tax=Dendrolimus kikuchii TaxID=765133 RepID=A0ACC1D690_9NEOP|nr:hypothetical protein K1T71_005043 [Dendrolimus kikuchii]